MASIEEKVEKLLNPIIEKIGYELYDVEYAKEGKNNFLRIFIDNPKGIDLNDCEKVNDAITDVLDKADFIKDQYFLEVSSTGLEKNLRKDEHFKKQIGNKIEVKLFSKLNNQNVFEGILKEFNNEYLIIETEDSEVKIDRNKISTAKTVYNWNEE